MPGKLGVLLQDRALGEEEPSSRITGQWEQTQGSCGNASTLQWLMAAAGAPASFGREMQSLGQLETLVG